MKIIGIGNALVDIVAEIPTDEVLVKLGLPKGAMTLIDEPTHNSIIKAIADLPQTVAAGGSAANTINGLAILGTPTAFIGKIAHDSVGEYFRNDQISNNIQPILSYSDSMPTGKCISLVSPCKERTMATHLGAASSLEAREVIIPTECSLVYLEGYLLYNHSLIESIMQQAKVKNVKIALDLASYNVVADNLDFLRELIEKYVDILFANEEEAREYTGMGAEEALELLAEQCEIAIVKIGARGSLVARGSERCKIGVIHAVPCDKTGAGDLYAAGFLYGLTQGYELKKCGDIGAVLSSKVVEVMGPKMDDNTWNDIKNLVKQIENGDNIVNIF